MLDRDTAVTMAKDLLIPALARQRSHIDSIDDWYRWEQADLELPPKATTEHKALAKLAKTPWLGLVVTNVSQALRVDGYRSIEDDSEGNAGPWRIFRANGMSGRQVAVHRAALAYGISFGTALPGVDDVTGDPMPQLRGVSPRKMAAFYTDPAEDMLPSVAIRADRSRKGLLYRLYDEDAVHYLGDEKGDGNLVYVEYRVHGVGVCPVVRFCNQLDLDGRTPGEVEPFIPLAQRINKTTYDRLLTQHFNSWKVRWATGLEEDPDPDEDAANLRRLRQNDLLVSESPDTRFGVLPETPLEGLIKAEEQAVKTLAAVSQTPTHAMVGDLINLSAEALAAARATLDAKVAERQSPFGESWAQWLRLGAHIAGDEDAANDHSAHVTWADTSIRSLAAAVDALGKAATMLQVPVEALWARIPGVTKDDVDEWREMRAGTQAAAASLLNDAMAATVPAGPI